MDEERLLYMRKLFTGDLMKFRESLLMMASLTDRNLTMALNALLHRDEEKANLVESEDAVIDQLEMETDEMVVNYISRHGTMATYTRLMMSASRISERLENIADQATSVARRARTLSQMPEVYPGIDIQKIGQMLLDHMRDSINAFVEVDPEKAALIVKKDKEIDALTKESETALIAYMQENSYAVPSCVHYLIICRSLEKAGDHVKKIAEDVYFLYTAEDIRHPACSKI